MIIEIDFNSDEAIYIQLRNQIVMGIAKEELQSGESLPSVRQMADYLGVNMHTVNKAYGMLRQEGYLTLDRRKGAVVSVQTKEKSQEVEEMNLALRMTIAQAICKEISKDEMHHIINQLYDEIMNIQED
ncbi:MAG TPA: GntR family transcriptional regulator [Candidatus Fimousia stercorigallinarum]|nr:GntR family transcriptional regulator [Candidatus Fimousia stercorigallinarum]